MTTWAMKKSPRFLGAAALALVALSGCGTLDKDDLHSAVVEVHSAAAEGVLLADEAVHRRLPTEFVWVHSQELRHSVVKIRDHLEGEIQAHEVQAYVPEAEELMDAVAGALHLLHRLPGNPEAAFAARQNLEHDSAQADELSEKLK